MIVLGVGMHIADVDPANLTMLHILNRVGATFAILACALTKTSWALTMIRIVRTTRDCMRVLVWCLLVSVNVFMDVGIILNFLQCDDTGLTGNPNEMWCWTNVIAAEYNIFSAGKLFPVHRTRTILQHIPPTNFRSLVWVFGHHSRLTSFGHHLAHANEN